MSKKSSTFATAFEKWQQYYQGSWIYELRKGKAIGAVVQLVRISACHAGGREFESRRHRKKEFSDSFFCAC